MMNLYHFVPENMQGSVLYSLNDMKTKIPKLFNQQAAKYKEREEVKETAIPGLGGWNDVIHLSPIDPNKVMAALKNASVPTDFAWKAFQINADTLDWAKLIIMVTVKDEDGYHKEFLPFTKENYEKHNDVPELTKQYYSECVAKGEQPLTYGGAPHVLYKGVIDTKSLKIIS